MTDSADMTEEQLDAAIFNNPSEHDVVQEESGQEIDPVSPLDDADGQPEDTVADLGVDPASEGSEDPDDSLSTEDDDVDADADEPTPGDEPEEGNPDADEEANLDADNEPVAFQPLRASGKEYPIESMQELYTLASKGLDADKKWNESSEGRRISATMKKNNLTQEDINMLVDLKGGSKDAILSLLKANDIDPLDMDADAFNGYKPKDHATGEFELALDDVIGRIKEQPRYDETVNVVMEKWDTKSREAFYEDPKLMELLNVDMQIDPETGTSIYDQVAPLAQKMKALSDGSGTDLDYYMQAGKKVLGTINSQKEAKAESERVAKEAKAKAQASIAKKKKAAAASGGQSTNSKTPVNVTDLSDEELDALLAE